GNSSTNTQSTDYTVSSETTATVPAGSFDVFRIDYTSGGTSGTIYLHDGLGNILNDSWELTSWDD
ncbi:MAG: hypothetical protein AAFV53_37455, partial [Myxococcota bacterium]